MGAPMKLRVEFVMVVMLLLGERAYCALHNTSSMTSSVAISGRTFDSTILKQHEVPWIVMFYSKGSYRLEVSSQEALSIWHAWAALKARIVDPSVNLGLVDW